MNSLVAGVQSAQSAKPSESASGLDAEHRRIDVTGLPANRVAEYLRADADSDGVYFERRAGKTFVVAPSDVR